MIEKLVEEKRNWVIVTLYRQTVLHTCFVIF